LYFFGTGCQEINGFHDLLPNVMASAPQFQNVEGTLPVAGFPVAPLHAPTPDQFPGMKTCSLPLPKVRLRALALTLSIAGACAAPKTSSVASPVRPDASPESVPPPAALLRPDAAKDTAPPPAPETEPIPELKFPGLTINARERCIDLDATVCLSEGALELVACRKEGKVHESIVAVEARPSHIHTALLLLGANNGTPAMRRPVNEAQTRWVDIPPTGDLIDVFLEFNNAEGQPVERPISDFMRRTHREDVDRRTSGPEASKEQRIPNAFIFAGSHLNDRGDGPRGYLADTSGHVISICTFGDELLCLPEIHSHQQGALTWEIDPTHLPKKGTPVTLRLRLKKSPEPEPNSKP
jgi:hypothetical protein